MYLLDPWASAWACPEWCLIHLALLELAVDWHGFAEFQAWYLEQALYLSWFRSWRRSLALSWGGPWPRLPGCPAGVHVVCDDWTDSPPYWNYPYALCLDILSANLHHQSICLLLAWNHLNDMQFWLKTKILWITFSHFSTIDNKLQRVHITPNIWRLSTRTQFAMAIRAPTKTKKNGTLLNRKYDSEKEFQCTSVVGGYVGVM